MLRGPGGHVDGVDQAEQLVLAHDPAAVGGRERLGPLRVGVVHGHDLVVDAAGRQGDHVEPADEPGAEEADAHGHGLGVLTGVNARFIACCSPRSTTWPSPSTTSRRPSPTTATPSVPRSTTARWSSPTASRRRCSRWPTATSSCSPPPATTRRWRSTSSAGARACTTWATGSTTAPRRSRRSRPGAGGSSTRCRGPAAGARPSPCAPQGGVRHAHRARAGVTPR